MTSSSERAGTLPAAVPPEDVPDDVKALIGTKSDWWTSPEPVDRSFIRRFADAILDDSEIYRDEAAARAAGFPCVVAPPTAIVRYPYGGVEIREAQEVFKDMVGVLVYGGRTHVHGGTRLRIFRAVEIGDVISQRTRLKNVTMKQGRDVRMGMIVRETVFVNQYKQILAHTEQIEFELP